MRLHRRRPQAPGERKWVVLLELRPDWRSPDPLTQAQAQAQTRTHIRTRTQTQVRVSASKWVELLPYWLCRITSALNEGLRPSPSPSPSPSALNEGLRPSPSPSPSPLALNQGRAVGYEGSYDPHVLSRLLERIAARWDPKPTPTPKHQP